VTSLHYKYITQMLVLLFLGRFYIYLLHIGLL